MNGPRPQASPGPMTPQKKAQYWWHRRHYPFYDYDWSYHDWYDYDYDYDWYDYDDHYYTPAVKAKRPPPKGPINTTEYSDDSLAYQQGFKDGWTAAMEHMMYGMEPPAPMPPAPMPVPPMPMPMPSDGIVE